jgi:arabinofuranosyltransferase
LALKPLAVGFAPLVAWEAFSGFYYGSLVPNTAYAKLNVTMADGEAVARGLAYFDRTIWADPATLPAMALAIVVVLWARPRRDWPLAAGLIATLGYVVWIGGDFMAGRFFTVPLIWSAALLASVAVETRAAAVMASALLVLGLLAPWEPAIVSGIGYARIDNLLRGRTERAASDGGLNITVHEITDVRRYYYEGTGLAKGQFRYRRPDEPGVDDGMRLREQGRQVVVRDSIGFVGYFAGPEPHIVDMFALTDPLLARLPAIRGSRVGHYQREIPVGYVESIEAGANRIADPDLSAYYDTLRFVVSGPLFDLRRIAAAVNLVAGRSDESLRRYIARAMPQR